MKVSIFLLLVLINNVAAYLSETSGSPRSTLMTKAASLDSEAYLQVSEPQQSIEKVGKVAFLVPDDGNQLASKFGSRSPYSNYRIHSLQLKLRQPRI